MRAREILVRGLSDLRDHLPFISPSTSFIYSPLEKDEIRLLSLQPEDFHSPISIRLESVRLKETKNTYEALSYAWGEPIRNIPIECNGSKLQVTASLEIALRYLRLEDRPRVLWIDAICINQDDLEERNEQVPLMRNIYPSAKQVLIWLGEEGTSTALALKTFEKLATIYSEDNITKLIIWKQFTSDLKSREGIAAARALTYRAWFNRCWAFQELILSQDARIICGNLAIPWITFSQGLYVYKIIRRLYPRNLAPNAPATHMGIAKNVRTRFKSNPTFLSRILYEGDFLRATDPRDRLFAFFSLVNFKNSNLFHPRYDMSICDTYIHFTKAIFREELSLCPLSQYSRRRTYKELPSWVPDWSGPCCATPIGHESQSYSLAADYMFESTYSVNSGFKGYLESISVDTGTELHLQGAFISLVAYVHALTSLSDELLDIESKPIDWRISPVLRAFAEKIDFMKKHRRSQSSPEEALLRTVGVDRWYYSTRRNMRGKHYPNHEILQRALSQSSAKPNSTQNRLPFKVARRIYGNAIPKVFLATNEQELEEGGESTQQDDMLEKEHQHLLRDVEVEVFRYIPRTINLRSLFFTSDGDIGLGPQDMKHGDMLCTLFGSDVPLILRPTQDNTNKFQLIGECYVDEIMEGELFNVSEDKKTIQPAVDGVKIREFILV